LSSLKICDSSSARWVGDNVDSHNRSLTLNQYALDHLLTLRASIQGTGREDSS